MDQVPEGCRITIVSDSCHSGGLIDEAKEQIGESTKRQEEEKPEYLFLFGFIKLLLQNVQNAFKYLRILNHKNDEDIDDRTVESNYGDRGYVRSRSLPLSTLIDILRQKTGKDDIDVGKLRPTLFDVFREDASPKVKKFMKVIIDKLQGDGGSGNRGFLGMSEFLKQKLENDETYAKPAVETEVSSKQEVYAGSTKRSILKGEVLVSGCQTNQTSADATPSGNSSEAYGALSNAIQTIIAATNGAVSNKELVMRARKMLQKQGFTQRPGLYCNDNLVEAPFVC